MYHFKPQSAKYGFIDVPQQSIERPIDFWLKGPKFNAGEIEILKEIGKQIRKKPEFKIKCL